VTGRVIWLPFGEQPTPPATVTMGGVSTTTRSDDGTFRLSVPTGSSALEVRYRPPGGAPVAFTFIEPPVTAPTDVGELWIGPQTVRLRGRVLSAADESPVAMAEIRFAGRRGVTAADGTFDIADVAYSAEDLVIFQGIEGTIARAGFLSRRFNAVSEAFGGIVTVEDLFLTPESSGLPPGRPFNVGGFVAPRDRALGTIVTVLRSGVPFRRETLGSGAEYGFWLPLGAYTLTYRNPNNGLAAPDETVVIQATNQIVRRDVTLQ
jgi:hypothetical protein